MISIAQFTSKSTKADAYVMFGFVPTHVRVITDHGGTNPDLFEWFDATKFDEIANADSDNDDAFKLTGSTGVVTVVDDAISTHSGGTLITSSNKVDYFTRLGANPTAGDYSQAGVVVKSGIQTNSKKNLVIAFRDDVE